MFCRKPVQVLLPLALPLTCWVCHPRRKGDCPLTRRLRNAHGSVTQSPRCRQGTPTAWCFSKKYTSDWTMTAPPFVISPITLGPSSRSLALHIWSFLRQVPLTDFSSLASYHIPKWAHHSNGLFAVLGTCQHPFLPPY